MAALSQELTLYTRIGDAAARYGLAIMGGLHPRDHYGPADEAGTLLLLGADAGFWPLFQRSPEYADGQRDPVDRWSARVMGDLAMDFDASVVLPFGGPPYAPFIDWALKSGRAWQSPVGMLVHDAAGMMISFRGALTFPGVFSLPKPPDAAPCQTCAARPCLATCPVLALSGNAPYDVASCHGFLDQAGGAACMSLGCAVRRACPVSQSFGRSPAQSAFHMKAFHPE